MDTHVTVSAFFACTDQKMYECPTDSFFETAEASGSPSVTVDVPSFYNYLEKVDSVSPKIHRDTYVEMMEVHNELPH